MYRRSLLWALAAIVPLFLTASGPIPDCQERTAYTTTDLRIRENPSTDAPIITIAPRSARVAVGDCTDGWCTVTYVDTNGSSHRGFAAQAYLSSQRPSTAAQAAPQTKPCCKICRKGKACGNSCINRNYTCRKPPGCACNG